MIVFCNGEFLAQEECRISPFDDGIMLGQGLFETIRVFNGKAEFLNAHLKRMLKGAGLMGISMPDINMADMVDGLIRQNQFGKIGRLKIVLYKRNNSKAGLLGFIKLYLPPAADLYKKGVVMGRGQHPKNGILAEVKTIDWFAFKKATQPDVFETILFSQEGQALEGSRTNLFIVENDALIFPLFKQRLAGIMEEHIRQQTQLRELPFQFKKLFYANIINADALFICNSLIGVMPARKFDNNRMKQNITSKISEIINQFQEAYAGQITN